VSKGITRSAEQVAGSRLLLAFAGKDRLPDEVLAAVEKYRPAGFTLFRSLNLDNPAQVLDLTQALQDAARKSGLPRLLIAVDQEGGQLMAVGGGTTPLPGNLAIGATGSTELARRAGEVLGRELGAMGINVDYAPCCDVNINPANAVVGTRSFGENPDRVAELSASMVEGIQTSGVAATAKHFPGHGDTSTDSHHALPVVPHPLERLNRVEIPPFKACIDAGVKLIMTAHLALPAIDGRSDLPATLSPAILKGLLRTDLAFTGVTVTDAMEMKAIKQGEELGQEAVRAAAAGADLLLLNSNSTDQNRIYTSLLEAVRLNVLDPEEMMDSAARIAELKRWIADRAPRADLSVVGCAGHLEVAREIAAGSVTLVRDGESTPGATRLLPIRLKDDQRLLVVMPRPQDLTPADTSSYILPSLAEALRAYHPRIDEIITPHAPQDTDIAALRDKARDYDLVIAGTLNASTQPGQEALVRALLQTGIPTIVVAMRMPYDLAAFPEAPTYLCTYSILEPSLRALAQAIFGQIEFRGRLPVSIPGHYPMGHGRRIG
jgi:beta-N-acetylhexosaminidase